VVVEVVAFPDLPAEITIAVVAIPVVDSAAQEDSDNIFFIINKAVSIDAAFFYAGYVMSLVVINAIFSAIIYF
jgi:hypothetical protein